MHACICNEMGVIETIKRTYERLCERKKRGESGRNEMGRDERGRMKQTQYMGHMSKKTLVN